MTVSSHHELYSNFSLCTEEKMLSRFLYKDLFLNYLLTYVPIRQCTYTSVTNVIPTLQEQLNISEHDPPAGIKLNYNESYRICEGRETIIQKAARSVRTLRVHVLIASGFNSIFLLSNKFYRQPQITFTTESKLKPR